MSVQIVSANLAATLVFFLSGLNGAAPVIAADEHEQRVAASGDSVFVRFLNSEGIEIADARHFDSRLLNFLVIHGFRSTGTSDVCLRQAAAVRQRLPGANVIIVDWRVAEPPKRKASSEANLLAAFLSPIGLDDLLADYQYNARCAEQIARKTAEWMKANDLSPSRTVISGHSLGAQIAGFVSNETSKPDLFGEPVTTILAADPAGPLFEELPSERRLDPSDARQVVVVHTTELFGDERAIGTIDMYVDWPDDNTPDLISRHSLAMEMVTDLVQAKMLVRVGDRTLEEVIFGRAGEGSSAEESTIWPPGDLK